MVEKFPRVIKRVSVGNAVAVSTVVVNNVEGLYDLHVRANGGSAVLQYSEDGVTWFNLHNLSTAGTIIDNLYSSYLRIALSAATDFNYVLIKKG